MGVTVRLDGLKALGDAFELMSTATAKREMTKVLLAAGAPIHAEAQAGAPERPEDAPVKHFVREGEEVVRRPGTLRTLVDISTKLSRRQASQARAAGKSQAEVYIGTRDPVARLEELGTQHAPPKAFLRPAWEAGKEQALVAIETGLRDRVEEIRRKAEARFARRAAKG